MILALVATLSLAAEPLRNVLVLHSDNSVLPGVAILDETLVKVLRANYGPEVELLSEFLGLDGPRPSTYEDELVAFLRKKHAGIKIDAILAVRGPALKFLLQRRDQLLPGVPVVHVWIGAQELAGMDLPRDVIGVPVKLEPEKTIELALRLHPGTRRVIVITGTSAFDRSWEALLRRAFKPLEARVAFEFWAGLPTAEILDRVRKLPRDCVVFLPGMQRDGTGQRLVPQEVAADIVSISPAPVYGNASNFREIGTMGGYIAPLEEISRSAGLLLAGLLRGEKPEVLVVPAAVSNAYILNMTQLSRYGFDKSALPADAILRFRQPTLWEAYRWHILLVVMLVLAQAALITALLFQRVQRRRAEKEAAGLSGRLLTAHEDERRHLARELHDDLTQRLARLAIDAGKLERNAGGDASQMRHDLVRLSEDVHALSYRLHPSVLDDLGLVEALRAECDRVASHGDVRVDVTAADLPSTVPNEASLCLFRVAQEALNNAVRHGRAKAMTVLLSAHGRGLQLAVSDNGSGFDPERSPDHASLGLASMRERVRLLHGRLDIESTPGRGTTVVAWVPA